MKYSPSFRARLTWTALVTLGLGALGPVADPQVPYDLEQFRPVLEDSKLQAPTSSPAMIERGDFAGKSNPYFFLDDTGTRLVFTVTGDSKRSELRQLSGDWDTATATPQRLVARVKVFVPETPELKQYTFLQIHDKKNGDAGLNKPLLRLTWQQNRKGKADHLWAAIRTPDDMSKTISLKNLATDTIDLGPRPAGFFAAEIRVQNGRMTVLLDGETKVDKDVSYWNGLANYFKAGVYNQDPGTSKAEFAALAYLTDDRAVAREAGQDSEAETPLAAGEMAEPE